MLSVKRAPSRTGKMGRHFPVREKSRNFEQTGKVRESYTKYWKTLENFRQKSFVVFSDIQMNCILFARMDQVFS